MSAIVCTYCGKANEAPAAACSGCGESLSQVAIPAEAEFHPLSKARIVRGFLWLGGGLLVTVGSFVTAGPGGTFWVAWGAILYGIFQLVTGMMDSRKSTSRIEFEEALESEFKAAVLLETEGNLEQARSAYQDIVDKYPGTKIARDARNTLESMSANTARSA